MENIIIKRIINYFSLFTKGEAVAIPPLLRMDVISWMRIALRI